MKSIQRRIFKARSILILLGLIALLFVVLLAETNQRPTVDTQITPRGTLSPQQQDLEQERQRIEKVLQQNGTANVFVAIKSPAWYELYFTPLDRNADSVALNTHNDALRTLASQARTTLLGMLTFDHVKVYDGSDLIDPSIALTIDQPAFDYMKTLSLIQSMIVDDYPQGTLSNNYGLDSGTPQMLYYTNTPDGKLSGR